MGQRGAMDDSYSPSASTLIGKDKTEIGSVIEGADGQLAGFTQFVPAKAPAVKSILRIKHLLRISTHSGMSNDGDREARNELEIGWAT